MNNHNKKSYWGIGVIIAFGIFILFSFGRLYIVANEKIDLVAENYYEKEIHYQEHIDAVQRTKELNSKIKISSNEGKISIQFPEEIAKNSIAGKIFFYRPSNQQQDFSIPLQLNSAYTQIIDVNSMEKGKWKIQLRWLWNGQEYYHEQKVFL